ncbi:hypothetical protein GCM10020255_043350 [Rhodococcus baikonurensis]
MTASKPRIALVGSGQMGSLHARVIAQSALCELDLLIEPREEQGKAVAARFDTRWAADFDSLDGIDAVVIAAATPAHYELAGRVLDLGKPVLVEKPLAATYEQSVDLVDRSRAAGVPLMCGLLERFNPAVRTAREFSGDVWQVNGIRHSPFVSRIPTGVATDLLIHDIDLAIGFAGSEPSLAKGVRLLPSDVRAEPVGGLRRRRIALRIRGCCNDFREPNQSAQDPPAVVARGRSTHRDRSLAS